MSRPQQRHPERWARTSSVRHRQLSIAESREELVGLWDERYRRIGQTTEPKKRAELRAGREGYAVHQGPREKTRRVRQMATVRA